MKRPWKWSGARGGAALLTLALLAGCGSTDTDAREPGPLEAEVSGEVLTDARDIRARLEAIPGLTILSDEQIDDFRFFVLDFEQPADHRHPEGERFQQRLTLFHRSVTAPMVMDTEGAEIFAEPIAAEPVDLLRGNQVTVEHRFYGTSKPASNDWRLLNIEQSAADAHRIVETFKPIYGARWLSTGVFRGGTAAILHRYFHPNDVQGTIPYAERHSLGLQDPRAAAFLARAGDAACREKLRTFQRTVLERRADMVAMMGALAADGITFDVLGADKALEIAAVRLPFQFWQYAGLAPYDCDTIPPSSASNEDVFGFLFLVTQLDATLSDVGLEVVGTPENYQCATELGSPLYPTAHLLPLLRYPGAEVPSRLPPEGVRKSYDPIPMTRVELWTRLQARRLLIVDGARSPWSAMAFGVSPWNDSYRVVDPEGIGFYGTLSALPEPARSFYFGRLSEWAGAPVQPPSGFRDGVKRAQWERMASQVR